ncbi:hypothetical protein CRG98_033284 [Punica granatum]|uniref:Uncharacterized protein n=1 Tax=Punica granatum TaxID=22663 RepID=A0A2I0IQP1_PUNGR|nr:hypothetical protein CRG98_033284 [Punica granatum]
MGWAAGGAGLGRAGPDWLLGRTGRVAGPNGPLLDWAIGGLGWAAAESGLDCYLRREAVRSGRDGSTRWLPTSKDSPAPGTDWGSSWSRARDAVPRAEGVGEELRGTFVCEFEGREGELRESEVRESEVREKVSSESECVESERECRGGESSCGGISGYFNYGSEVSSQYCATYDIAIGGHMKSHVRRSPLRPTWCFLMHRPDF